MISHEAPLENDSQLRGLRDIQACEGDNHSAPCGSGDAQKIARAAREATEGGGRRARACRPFLQRVLLQDFDCIGRLDLHKQRAVAQIWTQQSDSSWHAAAAAHQETALLVTRAMRPAAARRRIGRPHPARAAKDEVVAVTVTVRCSQGDS